MGLDQGLEGSLLLEPRDALRGGLEVEAQRALPRDLSIAKVSGGDDLADQTTSAHVGSCNEETS